MPKTSFSRLSCAVGEQLRLVRRSRNLTQTDVAQAVGIGQSVWSKIELGYSALTVHQLSLAAGRLGVRPSDIICAAESHIMWQLAKTPPQAPLLAWPAIMAAFVVDHNKRAS